MKRWIHASDDLERLAYTDADDRKQYLPMWCQSWSDEEIAKAKADAIHDSARVADIEDDYLDDDDAEMDAYIEEVMPQLRRAGYTRSQIDQIVNDLYAGRTLDYAMQRFS